ncbi:hypothetical protein PHYC_00748 [Phycisphaerales bacterium]|nr:hypothetical protein PHYC_00748 [Phycisphaerales bacterium]
MKMRFVMPALACSAALSCAISQECLAQELYRQNPINSFGGLSAQDARNPGGLGWFSEVVDNFDAPTNWVIGSVEFWGGYVTEVPGNTEGFMIRFYENNGGSVGALVSTQDVMTFSEIEYYHFNFGPPLGDVKGYHYTVQLTTPVPLNAGSYWMSVTAILARGGGANEPQWGWVQAQSITPPSCMQRFFSPTFNPQNQDVSFVLNAFAPPCDPDVNCDGAVNGFDVEATEQAVNGDFTNFCAPSADLNGDGAENGFDIETEEQRVNGAPC